MTQEQQQKILDLSATVKAARKESEEARAEAIRIVSLADNALVEAVDNLRRYANGLAINEKVRPET